MSRPIILCPQCGRELYHLHRPQCVWCDASLADDQFAQVAVNFAEPLPQTPMPMISPSIGTPWFGRSSGLFEGDSFSLIKRSISPWERKLRVAGAALFVAVMLARLIELFWMMWRVHQALPHAH